MIRKYFMFNPNNLKVIVADIDGTLITKGDLVHGFPARLPEIVREARRREIGFSLASGRDQYAQQELWNRITEDGAGLKPYEAICYEDSQLLMGDGRHYSAGGLSPKTLALIEQIEREHPEAFDGVVPLPGNRFTVRTARVTKEFAAGKGTNPDVLNRAYLAIKELMERLKKASFYGTGSFYGPEISTLHIGHSADAVDFLDRNSSKAKPFAYYVSILEESYSIRPEEVLVLGDATNDQSMMTYALEVGGMVGYVGKPEQMAIGGERRLEEVLQLFAKVNEGKLIIPSVRGPEGTVEVLERLLY